MKAAERLTAAAERGQMVLQAYDSDPSQRFFRLMVDLTAAADADGIDLRMVTIYAAARVEAWENGVT